MDHDLRRTDALRREGWTTDKINKAVSDGTLTRVRRSSYAPTVELDAEGEARRRVAAACGTRHPDCVVSHTSAALLHRLPVRAGALTLVHLTRWSNAHGKTTAGVRLHRAIVPDDQIVEIDGLRVTSLERTVVDVARIEPYAWSVAVADAALRRQLAADEVAEMLDRLGRAKGVGQARAAIEFGDARSESVAESMSRVSMVRAGIARPTLQWEVADAAGEWIATSDFGWEHLRLVGETDGRGKYVDDPQRGRTAADVVMDEKRRDQLILEAGWLPVHWGWDLATDHRRLGAFLRPLMTERARALGVRP